MSELAARLGVLRLIPAAGVAAVCAGVGALAGVDPSLAIVAALGVAFVLVTFADLTAGLVILILVVFLERVPLAGPVLSFTKIAGLLLALSWLARLATAGEGRRAAFFSAHPVASYVLVLFLAWAAISTSWAESSGDAFLDLSRYVLNAALFVIVFTAVQNRSQAGWVLGAFIAGAAATSVYGLVLRPAPEPEEALRFTSTIEDPNVLAAALVAGLTLALGALLALRRSPGLRLAAAGAAALCLVTFLLTGSRGGLVALGVALVSAVVLAGRWRVQAAAMALVVVLSAAVYVAAYAPPQIRDRIAETTKGETRAIEGRTTIWEVGWRMVEDNPVAGVGVGSFQPASAHYVLEPGEAPRSDLVVDRPPVAHNTYLHVLAELGVIGAALFLGIIGFSLRCAARAVRGFREAGDFRMEIIARALIVAVAGVLAADFFISEQFSKNLWLLLGLCPSLLAIAQSTPGRSAGSGQRPPDT